MDERFKASAAELLRQAAIFRTAARAMKDRRRAARLEQLADELTERAGRSPDGED